MKCAIDCALSQSYENIEIIVVNDGSTDGGRTEEIALSYGDRIRYFSKPNGGVSSALNYGISKMTGEYFSWLSHDDVYTSEKIKASVELLETNRLIGTRCVAFTSGYLMDAGGGKIKNFRKFFEANKMYFGSEVVSIMSVQGTLYGCCMLIPKTAFDEVGGFDETLRYSQDALMWYRIFLAGYSLISDDCAHVMCRIHRNQVSQLRRDLFEHDSLIIAKFLAEPLAKVDGTGEVLFQYIKRLTKYRCKDAISYLYDYARANGYLHRTDRLQLSVYKVLGTFRYVLATGYKKTLVLFRR